MNEGTASNGATNVTPNTDGTHKLDAVKGRLLDVTNKVVMRSNVMIEKTRSFVGARPLTALAIAFGVGYLGMRITRRFR